MGVSCPRCGSDQHRKTSEQASFQVLASRRCLDCGHFWEPPAPTWLLWVGMIVGIVWVVMGVLVALGGLIFGGPVEPHYLWLSATGLAAIWGCWRRVRVSEAKSELIDPGPQRRWLPF